MGREVYLGGVLGAPLGNGLGLRPQSGGPGGGPTIQLLLVGGGGAALEPISASQPSGGGAGGEVLEVEIPSPPIGSYPVAVGIGGIAGESAGLGPAGRPTVFGNILGATGGGSGVPSTQQRGIGANGGGDGFYPWQGFIHQRFSTAFLGNMGGSTFDDGSGVRAGGGGGGAGGPGSTPTLTTRGLGGSGKFSQISGVLTEYARGGDGLHSSLGAGPTNSTIGGGASAVRTFGQGINGNAGILIFRYLTGTQSWTGGNVSQVGPWTVHTFTADGTATRLS